MSGYIGNSLQDLLGTYVKRYFYGIRRTDDGDLFFMKYDQIGDDTLIINNAGVPAENYPNFTEGQDFFEGRDQTHEIIYANLNYEQFLWDDRSLTYILSDDGNFILKTDG